MSILDALTVNIKNLNLHKYKKGNTTLWYKNFFCQANSYDTALQETGRPLWQEVNNHYRFV